MSTTIRTEYSTAISRWKSAVSKHHAQSERVNQGVTTGEDQWDHIADLFQEDPHRTGDQVLNAVLSAVSPQDDVLDVGGGAGRYALPLALHCLQGNSRGALHEHGICLEAERRRARR